MSLDAVLTAAEQRRKELVVYTPEETEIIERLAARNVTGERRALPADRSESFCVIRDGSAFLGAIGLADLKQFLEPPVKRPEQLETLDPAYRAVFELLDDTVFSALSRRQLLASSREFEERACRHGTGRLHVGFQSREPFQAQESLYRTLAAETDLDVHIYIAPDWVPEETGALRFHHEPASVIERYWFVAFEGGDQQCALVAQERNDTYDGVWTYDPELVGMVFDAVT